MDFKNTVIIMTSNLPQEQLHSFFRPEFLNRIDDIVVFHSLTQNEIEKIVGLTMKSLEKRLADRDMKVEMTPEATHLIAMESYDEVYGARPVKRYIQKHVENEIAELIIRGDLTEGHTVRVDAANNKLNFSVQ